MEKFKPYDDLAEQFQRFERAAAKGYEEAIWILSVVKDAKMERSALKEAFAETEEPLGWWFAGVLAEDASREEFVFYKKSAEAGCSWGQNYYGLYFDFENEFVEESENAYLEWMEKAAQQNNPEAMDRLGDFFRGKVKDKEKSGSYYRAAAELGSRYSAGCLSRMFFFGKRCEKDLRQAAKWSARASTAQTSGVVFWDIIEDARLGAFEKEDLGGDSDQLCYALGCGSYWYVQHIGDSIPPQDVSFANSCLDYYCSCVELQQKSIFTFLLCWKQMGLSKDVGLMIAKMVWEKREDNLVKSFEINE
jgi:hypothetical protein